jgi:hypothetical protein
MQLNKILGKKNSAKTVLDIPNRLVRSNKFHKIFIKLILTSLVWS